MLETATPAGSPTTAPAARLLVRSSGRAARVLLLDRRVLSIGSDDACWLPVRDSLVQPVQCLLVRGRKRTIARNLNGTTLVNGRRLEETELRSGDVLQVGRCTIEYQDPAARSAAPQTVPVQVPPRRVPSTIRPRDAAPATNAPERVTQASEAAAIDGRWRVATEQSERSEAPTSRLLARLEELESVLRAGIAALHARDEQLDHRLAELHRRSEELGTESARQAEQSRAASGAQHELAARLEALVTRLREEQQAWQVPWDQWRQQVDSDLQHMADGLGRVQKQFSEFRAHQAAENRQRAARHDALFEWQARIAAQMEQIEERIAELRQQRVDLGAAQHEREQLSHQFAELKRAVEARLDELQRQSQALAQRCEQLTSDWLRQSEEPIRQPAVDTLPVQPPGPLPGNPSPESRRHAARRVTHSAASTHAIDWQAYALRAADITGGPDGSEVIAPARPNVPQAEEETLRDDAGGNPGADSQRETLRESARLREEAGDDSTSDAVIAPEPLDCESPLSCGEPAQLGFQAEEVHAGLEAADDAGQDGPTASWTQTEQRRDDPQQADGTDAVQWTDQDSGEVAPAQPSHQPDAEDDQLPWSALETDEEPSQDGAGCHAGSPDETVPAAADPTIQAHSAAGDEPHEETIEEYMARLLGRVRALQGEVSHTKASPTRQEHRESEPPRQSSPARSASAEPEPPAPPPCAVPTEANEAHSASAGRSRSPAPEASMNMAALRELANANAHQALAVHSRDKMSRAMKSKLVVSIVALLSSFGLMWCSATTNSTLIYAASVGSLLTAIIYGVQYLVLTGQLFAAQAMADSNETGDVPGADDTAA